MALDSQSLLGANVMELYTILKQVASLSEEDWEQLPLEGTANLLKLVKIQELLSENKDMTQDELFERGLNTSITHVDFMIGSAEMDINGITEDGQEEPVFRNGNWAI